MRFCVPVLDTKDLFLWFMVKNVTSGAIKCTPTIVAKVFTELVRFKGTLSLTLAVLPMVSSCFSITEYSTNVQNYFFLPLQMLLLRVDR